MRAFRTIISYVALFASLLGTGVAAMYLFYPLMMGQPFPINETGLWIALASVVLCGASAATQLLMATDWRRGVHTAPYGYVLVKRWPKNADVEALEPYKSLILDADPPIDEETRTWVLAGCHRMWNAVLNQSLKNQPVPRMDL